MIFNVRTETRDGWTVVRVLGEIDLASAPQLRAALRAAVDGVSALAVDLHECDFIDSVGVGLLLGASRRCLQQGTEFAVLLGDGAPRRLFELCRLDEILTVLDAAEPLAGAE